MKHRVYVVNLPSSLSRREYTSKMLSELDIEYHFYAATDGRHLSESEKALCLDTNNVDLKCAFGGIRVDSPLTLGEKGCAFSHLHIYQDILDKGLDYAIIMEDDIDLNKDTIEAFKNIDVITEKWDIINFTTHQGLKSLPFAKKYYFNSSKKHFFCQVGMRNNLLDSFFNRRRLIANTYLYVISAKACKHLIEIGYPVRIPADYLTGLVAYNNLKIFRPFPIGNFVRLRDISTDIGLRPNHLLYKI